MKNYNHGMQDRRQGMKIYTFIIILLYFKLKNCIFCVKVYANFLYIVNFLWDVHNEAG